MTSIVLWFIASLFAVQLIANPDTSAIGIVLFLVAAPSCFLSIVKFLKSPL